MSDTLKEKLAAIEHTRWADWQKWCHQTLRDGIKLGLSMEAILKRWDRQIETPYDKLSDKEKASDMEQVDRYWHLIQQYVDSECLRARRDELETLRLVKGKMTTSAYGLWVDNYCENRIRELNTGGNQ